jgi:hypothetical protein
MAEVLSPMQKRVQADSATGRPFPGTLSPALESGHFANAFGLPLSETWRDVENFVEFFGERRD